jgi:hypothetical protein
MQTPSLRFECAAAAQEQPACYALLPSTRTAALPGCPQCLDLSRAPAAVAAAPASVVRPAAFYVLCSIAHALHLHHMA